MPVIAYFIALCCFLSLLCRVGAWWADALARLSWAIRDKQWPWKPAKIRGPNGLGRLRYPGEKLEGEDYYTLKGKKYEIRGSEDRRRMLEHLPGKLWDGKSSPEY